MCHGPTLLKRLRTGSEACARTLRRRGIRHSCLIPHAFPCTAMSALIVGRAILPWGPLWGRLSGGSFGLCLSATPAKSRRQPGLAAPQGVQHGCDQKVYGIRQECLCHVCTV